MKIIVVMAGSGQRFVDAGYSDPKPLIKAGGESLVSRIVKLFDKENDDFVFIVNRGHQEKFNISEKVAALVPESTVFVIDEHKLGPVHSVNQILDTIQDDEEVVVTYCDNPYLWNYQEFKDHVAANNLDGCIISHKGFHPHRLASTFMAYMQTDGTRRVTKVQEKKPFTDNHWEENASIGTYYFKRGEYIKKYFPLCREREEVYNNEEYVTLSYNLLIEDGLNIGIFDTQHNLVLGTPTELENFNAWSKIVEGAQCRSTEDAAKCFQYWSNYLAKDND